MAIYDDPDSLINETNDALRILFHLGQDAVLPLTAYFSNATVKELGCLPRTGEPGTSHQLQEQAVVFLGVIAVRAVDIDPLSVGGTSRGSARVAVWKTSSRETFPHNKRFGC